MTVAELAYTLEKPFAIVVEVNGKPMKKEFDTEAEVLEFARTLKAKMPDAKAEFIRRRERVKGLAGQAYSLGFRPVMDQKTGKQLINSFGRPTFKPVRVPEKRGLLFCTNCHDYKRFARLRTKYGLDYTGCPDCGLSTNDFDVKTCNGLWERMPR